MANSYVEYSSGLTATTYSIPFNYIAIADVEVKGYNGSTWSDLTVASRDNTAKTITLSAAPSTYQKIRVWRNSSTAQLVDFQNGSRLSETDLDTAYQQGLFVAQEVSEGASTVTASGTSNVSLSGTTTVADLALTGNTTGLDVNGTDIILDADGDSKIEASADDVVAIHTGGSERMRIDSSGNVGIGTSPSTDWRTTFDLTAAQVGLSGCLFNLDVSTGDRRCMMTSNAILNSSGDFQHILEGHATIYSQQSGTHRWYTAASASAGATASASERMRIDSSGKLLVGTTASNSTGLIQGRHNTGASNAVITTWNEASSGTRIHMQFLDSSSGGDRGSITTNGSATAYNTSSDYRLKTDAQPMTGATARLKALNPVNFEWIADGTRVDGFLAHEAQAVVPASVTGTKDEVDDEGNPVMQGIDQAKLVPLLTAALQEAIAKIEVLETKVAALEA